MRCPKCGGGSTTTDTRPTPQIFAMRRRHECRDCRYRFTTYEICPETLSANPAHFTKLLLRFVFGVSREDRQAA